MAQHAEIHIKGQKELEVAFMKLRRDVFLAMKAELVKAGRVVKEESQVRAGDEISNIGTKWQRMRIGATVKGVYVAPATRPSGGPKRPNLAPLLLHSMEGALEAKKAAVEAEFEALVDLAAAKNGFF